MIRTTCDCCEKEKDCSVIAVSGGLYTVFLCEECETESGKPIEIPNLPTKKEK